MIVSYKGKLVESVAAGKVQKGFPANLLTVAERRLAAVANAFSINDLRSPSGNRLEAIKVIGKSDTRSASTTNGGFVSSGPTPAPRMLRSSIITIERPVFNRGPG